MDQQDLDKETYERRKKEILDYRAKKRSSSTFVFLFTIYEVLISIVLFLGLFVGGSFLCRVILGEDSGIIASAFYITAIVALVGGVVGGFFIYKATAKAVIKKMHLEDKLSKDVLYHYMSKKEREEKALEEMQR